MGAGQEPINRLLNRGNRENCGNNRNRGTGATGEKGERGMSPSIVSE